MRDNYAKEIDAVWQQYPAEPFKFLDPPLRLEYPEAVAMLKEKEARELEKKYGANKEGVDFKYSQRTKPAIVIKAKTVPEYIE